MNNLETVLKKKGEKSLFMAHMIAGYPSTKESEQVAKALVHPDRSGGAQGGADIIEMQIPFSDPMADGPTIAVACEEALRKGATVADSLALLKVIAAFGKPVVVMSYLNPVFRIGLARFVETIAASGASALIVPDCPFDSEEGKELIAVCKENNVFFIPVVSPGVPKERLEQLAPSSQGFVYCTTRQGITGASSKFSKDLADFVPQAKKIFNLPVAVGFGVKSKEDVRSLAKFADIVIAGSVFVDAIKKDGVVVIEKTMNQLRI